MATIQLNFTLRTSANVKTVHLLGTWDGYQGQLPLSKDTKKSGGWKGNFRFQGTTLKPGQRYWYYYIIDGYHVSHDPAREHTVEPTTGRKLNILDIPAPKVSANIHTSAPSKRFSHTRNVSIDIPKGRALSPSKIQSPRPTAPHKTRKIVNAEYSQEYVDQLTNQFARQALQEEYYSRRYANYSPTSSDADSDVPSLTTSSRSSGSSSPSSVSSTSSCCTCERYGITRSGGRVKLDCGVVRCGNSDDGSSCSSESDEEAHRVRQTRRQGMVVGRK